MKPAAAFTIVQDASAYLPQWVAHYCNELGEKNVYILDHDSQGDHQDMLWRLQEADGFHVLDVHHEFSYDIDWLPNTVSLFQKYLLQSYEAVVFAGADEIITPSPESDYTGLRDYLEKMSKMSTVRCNGFEVVHRRDAESGLDFSLPSLLKQRTWWYHARRYSKPAVSKGVSLYWQEGFDKAVNFPTAQDVDRNLLSIHMHKADFDQCLQRHREAVTRRWHPGDRQGGPWRHALLEEIGMMDKWILANADRPNEYAELQKIPDSIKELF